MKIDGHTRLAAVIAKPIKHSISPFIHNLGFLCAIMKKRFFLCEKEEDASYLILRALYCTVIWQCGGSLSRGFRALNRMQSVYIIRGLFFSREKQNCLFIRMLLCLFLITWRWKNCGGLVQRVRFFHRNLRLS